MGDEPSRPPAPKRGAELNTWSVIYCLLGWLSLAAALIGGAGEAPYYLAAGLTLLPLAIGFWFRWTWSRWAGLGIFFAVALWSIWQLAHWRVMLLGIALLLTSLETLFCLWRWPIRRGPDDNRTR